MADLDVSDVLDDPDFNVTVDVVRTAVATMSSGLAEAQPAPVSIVAVVIPDAGMDLIQTGEGDAIQADITVYTRFDLTQGDALYGADIVYWQGDPYRVIRSQPYAFGSGYTRAACKLTSINPSPLSPPLAGGYLG